MNPVLRQHPHELAVSNGGQEAIERVTREIGLICNSAVACLIERERHLCGKGHESPDRRKKERREETLFVDVMDSRPHYY